MVRIDFGRLHFTGSKRSRANHERATLSSAKEDRASIAAKFDQAMPGTGYSERRKQLSASDIERAASVVRSAWDYLPPAHRVLLETIDVSQWQVVNEPLGVIVDGFLRSAGHRTLPPSAQRQLDLAQGVWLQ